MKKIITMFLSVMIFVSCLIPISYATFDDCYDLYESWDGGLKQYATEISKEYDIPYSMVVAIIYHESRFKPNVGSTYIGLMQVGATKDVLAFLKKNGLNVTKADLYDPKINIRCGAEIFNYAKSVTSNLKDAVYVYACGEGAVKSRKKQGLPYNKATNEIYDLYCRFEDYLNNEICH